MKNPVHDPVAGARSQPGRHVSTVVDNVPLSRRYYLLVLSRPVALQEPEPGTFIHLMVPDGGRFFLRRPFSVLDCDAKTISLIIVEKGGGTQLMRVLRAGAQVDFIGPLGSSFPTLPGRRVLALAGGVGLAPLYLYWSRRRGKDAEAYRLLYGARNEEDLFIDKFDWRSKGIGLATDDGSYGFAGTVVEFAESEIARSPADVVFSCGPTPMLKAAARFAVRHGLPHYVSLENRMACAVGACRSCAVLTRSGETVRYRTVCHDGPVFDADTLVWEELPDA